MCRENELDELEPYELWALLSHAPLDADEIEDSMRDKLEGLPPGGAVIRRRE